MSRHEYTVSEYADMHLMYGKCRGDAVAAAKLYQEKYPSRHHPDNRVFLYVHRAYCEGQIPGKDSSYLEDIDEEKLENVEGNPSTSERKLTRSTGIPDPEPIVHSPVRRYEVQRAPNLLPTDYSRRVKFCQMMLRKIKRKGSFLNKILWSDETACSNDGYDNMHNLHSWYVENPHTESQFNINFWTGLLNGQVIGPHELPRNFTGKTYLDFLENELSSLLLDVPLASRQHMLLQNNGSPAHSARGVRKHLDKRYPGRWIGRLGPIVWPERSPDLNPMIFFYWGTLKHTVYETKVTSASQLRARVKSAAEKLSNAGYAGRIRSSCVNRYKACIRANGGLFEHFL